MKRDLAVILHLFLASARLQKKRATLTIASLAWGTVTILLLLAFGEGLKRQMMSNDQAMGNNLAIMWPGETSKPYKGLPEGRPIRPKLEDIDYARERLPELDAIWGELTSWRTALTYGRKTVNGRVIGTRFDYGDARKHFPTRRGRFINPQDEEEKRRVVFLGNEMAKDIFGPEDPLGKRSSSTTRPSPSSASCSGSASPRPTAGPTRRTPSSRSRPSRPSSGATASTSSSSASRRPTRWRPRSSTSTRSSGRAWGSTRKTRASGGSGTP